jgi:hypothetical protein
MASQFHVDGGKIRGWVDPPAGRRRSLGEQELVEFLIAEVFRQRPANPGYSQISASGRSEFGEEFVPNLGKKISWRIQPLFVSLV